MSTVLTRVGASSGSHLYQASRITSETSGITLKNQNELRFAITVMQSNYTKSSIEGTCVWVLVAICSRGTIVVPSASDSSTASITVPSVCSSIVTMKRDAAQAMTDESVAMIVAATKRLLDTLFTIRVGLTRLGDAHSSTGTLAAELVQHQ